MATANTSLTPKERQLVINALIHHCPGCGFDESDRPLLNDCSDEGLAAVWNKAKEEAGLPDIEDNEDDEEDEDDEDDLEDNCVCGGESQRLGDARPGMVGNAAGEDADMVNVGRGCTTERVLNAQAQAKRKEQRLSDLRKRESAGLGARGFGADDENEEEDPNSTYDAQAHGNVAAYGETNPSWDTRQIVYPDAGEHSNADTYHDADFGNVLHSINDLDQPDADTPGPFTRIPGMQYPTTAELMEMETENHRRLGMTANARAVVDQKSQRHAVFNVAQNAKIPTTASLLSRFG